MPHSIAKPVSNYELFLRPDFCPCHQLIPLFLLLNLIGHLMLYISYRYRKNIKATFGIDDENEE